MAQLPINLPELTDAEIVSIRTNINAIKNILAPKFTNLEPDDRQEYGSVSETNKLIINKVKDYRENMPALSSPDVNWVNFGKEWITRKNYMMVRDLLNEVDELCNDPRTIVDYVLFGQAREDYRWTKFRAGTSGGATSGYEAKYNELKQFFVKGPSDDDDGDTGAENTSKDIK